MSSSLTDGEFIQASGGCDGVGVGGVGEEVGILAEAAFAIDFTLPTVGSRARRESKICINQPRRARRI